MGAASFRIVPTVASKGSGASHIFVQECDACGLMFGGGGACPSCGSRTSHIADVEENGKDVAGADLPGIDQLVDSIDGVDMVDVELKKVGVATSLPFSFGGSTGGKTTLPFGVGSPSRGVEDDYHPSRSIPAPTDSATATGQSPLVRDDAAGGVRDDAAGGVRDNAGEGAITSPSVTVDEAEGGDQPTIAGDGRVGESDSESDPMDAPPAPSEMVVNIGQPAAPSASEEVVLVARVLAEAEPSLAGGVQSYSAEANETMPPPQFDEAANQDGFVSGSLSDDGTFSTSDGTVAGVDQDVILHQDDVIYHDFGDEAQVSEVVIDYDSLVDPAVNTVTFDPSVVGDNEPELMPARALAVTGLAEAALKEAAHIGFAALAEADWEKAADCFKTICASHPTNAAALNNFGLTLLQQALLIQEVRPMMNAADEPHFEASVLALRQAAKASQGDVSVICNLATALTSCHRHEDAIKFYDVALRLDPDDTPSMNGKAVSLVALREFDEATILLRAASSIDPDNDLIAANLRRISPMG